MKLYNKLILALAMIFVFQAFAGSEDKNRLDQLVVLDRTFYLGFIKIPPINRDFHLNSHLNRVVQTIGTVTSIERFKRYKKNFRITLVDNNASKFNLNIIYYLFLDDQESINMLTENQVFEFSGQLVASTPLNIKRDSYILDIIFEKGAVIIK